MKPLPFFEFASQCMKIIQTIPGLPLLEEFQIEI
jgi:hypothetical protein